MIATALQPPFFGGQQWHLGDIGSLCSGQFVCYYVEYSLNVCGYKYIFQEPIVCDGRLRAACGMSSRLNVLE